MHKIPLIAKVVSLYFVMAVSVMFSMQASPATASTTNNQFISQITTVEEPQPVVTQAISGTPVRLQLPRLGIDLPIEPGQYSAQTDTWTLSNTAVHIAETSPLINDQTGHSLVYGHAKRTLLGPTKDLALQDTLIITTDTGHVFTYAYTGNEVVNPTDTSILQKTSEKPLLTLLTCDGLFYEKRRLMTFVLTGVQ